MVKSIQEDIISVYMALVALITRVLILRLNLIGWLLLLCFKSHYDAIFVLYAFLSAFNSVHCSLVSW